MRDYKNIDRYITKLYQDIYPQPEDAGHGDLAMQVITNWCSKLTSAHSVLDVGAGQGFCQPMFESFGMVYEGVALGEDVVIAQGLGRNIKKMDFSFLDYPDNSFDLIFSRHSLEHSPMPILSLMEWNRVSSGFLGIVLPAPEWYTYKGLNHYSVMTMEHIKQLLDRAGWHVIWDEVKELEFEAGKPETLRPHEYWIMSEKKR